MNEMISEVEGKRRRKIKSGRRRVKEWISEVEDEEERRGSKKGV